MTAATLNYLILGLLQGGPRTGYEIQCIFQLSPVNVGSRSFGSIYPALRRLEKEGLVTVEVIPQEGRPAKKLARLTDAGKSGFLRWLKEPLRAQDAALSRDPFAEKFLFFGCLPPAEAARACREHLAQIQAAREQAGAFAEQFGESLDRFAAWNLKGAAAVMDARIAWLEEICRSLEAQPEA